MGKKTARKYARLESVCNQFCFRGNTVCVRNWAMIGKKYHHFSALYSWMPRMDSKNVALDISLKIRRNLQCQGTRFEISLHRDKLPQQRQLPTKNQWLQTTRSHLSHLIIWSDVLHCTMSPDVICSMIWNKIRPTNSSDFVQHI